MKKVTDLSKRYWKYILVAIIALYIGSTIGGTSTTEYNSVLDKNKELLDKNKELSAQSDNLSKENKELQAKVDEAKPYFALAEQERQAKIEEGKRKEAEAKAQKEAEEKAKAEEKARADAEAKRLAEEKAKKGYDTGITYDQLARTPDQFKGEKVKLKGKVVQVMEGTGKTQIRLAVGSNYDTILFGEFDTSIVQSRVLENDVITVMGTSTGILTYKSTMGGNISIPGMTIEKIEQ
ncbi:MULTISPECIES: toxin regulator [Bacillus cereus group]|uniref:toxin regulator n=1 Tax=Bacillus cereus group TaxID=86661 RepID=UPI0022E2AC1D|nr:toxin regulator [Bacillus cereus group sp. BcHK140]MDA1918356.1 toxin regulator [Bacillus cereus group sp. BcHK140]